MVSKSVVRTGVLLVLALGIVTMLAGPVAASSDCTNYGGEWPCESEGPPLYEGNESDVRDNVSDVRDNVSGVGGTVSDALGSLPDLGEVVPLPA